MRQIEVIAYELLSLPEVADLRATRDAIELADLIINNDPDALITFLDDKLDLDDDDACIEIMDELREIMTEMILHPVD